MIQILLERKYDAIIDIKLGNVDADYYRFEPMAALLACWEKIKKDKQIKYFLNKRGGHPFVLSVNGILGMEALVVLANLSQVMAAKMEKHILHTQSCINGRFATAVARYCAQMIRRYQLPSPLQDRELDWDPTSGFRLAH